MIDRRSSGIANLHMLMVAGAGVLWWFVLAGITRPGILPVSKYATLWPHPIYAICIAGGIVFSIRSVRSTDGDFLDMGWTEAMKLGFRQTVAAACAVFALVVAMKDAGISRVFLAVYFSTALTGFVLLNRFQPGWLVRKLLSGDAQLPTLILGESEGFPDIDRWLAVRRKFGLAPVGLISYRGAVPQISGLAVNGEFSDLKAAIVATGARQVLMLSLPHDAEDAEHLARVCASCGCRLLIHNNLTLRLEYPLRVFMQDGYSFLGFQDEPLEDPLNRIVKRAIDVTFSLLVVVFVLPPLALLVWGVQRWQSPGPVFYVQPRSGFAGRAFRIFKFRTMRIGRDVNPSAAGSPTERIFPFGRFLRRTSLDELPQFLNVLLGEMSVVGPRPHFVVEDDRFSHVVNEYRVRFFVKPGITGLAQSHGLRGEIHTDELIQQRIQLDLLYIHNWSIWLDAAIIARTTRQVFAPPPAAR